MERLPRAAQHAYTLGVVSLAWVFFRTDDLRHALDFLTALLGQADDTFSAYPLALYLDHKVAFFAVLAVVLCGPGALATIDRTMARVSTDGREALRLTGLASLLLCAMALAAGTHNPFIYFRF
jgi:alginate O-acetyltransferase complex protein AlgI